MYVCPIYTIDISKIDTPSRVQRHDPGGLAIRDGAGDLRAQPLLILVIKTWARLGGFKKNKLKGELNDVELIVEGIVEGRVEWIVEWIVEGRVEWIVE